MGSNYNCTGCGRQIWEDNDNGAKYQGWIQYNGGWFHNRDCLNAFMSKNNGSSGETSGGSTSGAGADIASAGVGAGVGLAAVGAGAAVAGVGAAVKGIGKGAGVMADAMKSGLDGTKAEFGKTHSAEEEIIAINKKVFSSDPEEYKKEIWALFDKATSKPADPLRDTFVIKAAKKKLIHELDVCKLKNPEMFTQFTQLYEELTKKKKLFGIFG